MKFKEDSTPIGK